MQQWLHPGFELVLHRDESEGYYLNVSVRGARVFVLWRMDEDKAVPLDVTVSYNEGGRWLDGGHSVDGVAMPPEIFAWVGEFVEQNYRPERQEAHQAALVRASEGSRGLMAAGDKEEAFLSRWSRLKQEQAREAPRPEVPAASEDKETQAAGAAAGG